MAHLQHQVRRGPRRQRVRGGQQGLAGWEVADERLGPDRIELGEHVVEEQHRRHPRGLGEQGVAFRREHYLGVVSAGFAKTELGDYFRNLFVERNIFYDVQTIITMFKALGETDPEWLFDIPCPMLILTGSEDGSHPESFALQRKVGGCELVTIPGAGHTCQMEQPWVWDSHAARFLVKHGLMEPGLMAGA